MMMIRDRKVNLGLLHLSRSLSPSLSDLGLSPSLSISNFFSNTSPLSIGGGGGLSGLGKQIHAHVFKFGYGADSVTVANTLVNFYRKCGDLGAVHKVFDRITERNQVSWNSLISSLCSFENWEMALEAFRCMLDEDVEPSSFTLVSVAIACSNLREGLLLGKQVHGYSLRKGELNSFMVNTLVAMYGKLGKLGFCKVLLGSFEGRDLVTWNTVLSSLCQNEEFLEALEYLREMVLKGVEPDGFSISNVLPVCSHLELLRTGKEIHAYGLKNGSLDENSFVGSALVDMYCNCKRVVSARRVFDGIFDRKIGLWNAMIAGYAQNEHDEEALSPILGRHCSVTGSLQTCLLLVMIRSFSSMT